MRYGKCQEASSDYTSPTADSIFLMHFSQMRLCAQKWAHHISNLGSTEADSTNYSTSTDPMMRSWVLTSELTEVYSQSRLQNCTCIAAWQASNALSTFVGRRLCQIEAVSVRRYTQDKSWRSSSGFLTLMLAFFTWSLLRCM